MEKITINLKRKVFSATDAMCLLMVGLAIYSSGHHTIIGYILTTILIRLYCDINLKNSGSSAVTFGFNYTKNYKTKKL